MQNKPITGNNNKTPTIWSITNNKEKVKPRIAGTILSVNHTMKISIKIENKVLITLPPTS